MSTYVDIKCLLCLMKFVLMKKCCQNISIYIYIYVCVCLCVCMYGLIYIYIYSLVSLFNSITNFVGYLMPKPSL